MYIDNSAHLPFLLVFSVVSIAWVYVFYTYMATLVEQRTLEALCSIKENENQDNYIFAKKNVKLHFVQLKDFNEGDTSVIYTDPISSSFPAVQKTHSYSWENDYNYDTTERTPYSFVYNDTGVLWEERMGIDFSKEDWYIDIDDVMSRIYGNRTRDMRPILNTFYNESKGYSHIIFSKNYAYVSNACVNVKNGQVTIFTENEESIMTTLSNYKWKDFYFNPYKFEKKKIPEKLLKEEEYDLLVSHPRSTQNMYQFLEGTSYLINIALHPESFPKFRNLLLLTGQKGGNLDSYTSLLLQNMIALFPKEYRPHLLNPFSDKRFSDHNVLCNRIITFIRNWEPIGSGSFIGTLLAADLFRANIYNYVHYYPTYTYPKQLKLVLSRRTNNRMILNHNKLLQRLERVMSLYYVWDDIILEDLSIEERIIEFISTDVYLGVYGTGLTTMLFMTKNSYLIEVYPPYWYWSCYQRFAKSVGIGSSVMKTKGEKGPECATDEKGSLCQQKGIRDRNFNISIPDAIRYLWTARRFVLESKYDRQIDTFS